MNRTKRTLGSFVRIEFKNYLVSKSDNGKIIITTNLTSLLESLIIKSRKMGATGFDRSFWRPTDAMPGYLMQLVKKRREKTIANNNELALAA